jgi:ABC-type multidrug transport system fused ATPase/permease subunit
MSLAMHALLQWILPFATMVVAVAILVWTSPLLSAVLLPAVLLYFVPLRAINRRTSEATEEFEAADRKARALTSERLRTLVDEGVPAADRRASVEQIVSDPQWLRAGYYFYQRRLSDDRLHLLTSAFTYVSAAVIIVFFAATRSLHQSWASVLVYLVALRTAVGAARHASGIFVQLCRFFPIYVEYVDFIDAAERIRARRAALAGAGAEPAGLRGLSFRCAGRFDAPGEDGHVLRMRRGEALVLLVPWEPTAADLEGAAAVLESAATEPADLVSGAKLRRRARGARRGPRAPLRAALPDA